MPKLQKAVALLDPKHQTQQSLGEVLGHILRQGGCPTCGRLSVLAVDFIVDPAKETIPGVIALQVQHAAGE